MPTPDKSKIVIRRANWLQQGLQRFYTWYVGLVLRSTRWQYVGFETAEADIAKGIPRIYCLWHGRLALIPYFREWNDHPMATFVSKHPDAQLATGFMRKRGIKVIPVQTSGSKISSVRTAVRLVKGGSSLGITPDGPFGPRAVVQPGAVLIGSLARARLTPVAFSTRRRITLKTWDRFVLPLPFGRGVFVMEDGFVPPARLSDSEMAEAQKKLGRMIDRVTQEADRLADGGAAKS